MDKNGLIIAVDGGGSTSDVAVYDAEGQILDNTLIGPLSRKSSSREDVLRSLCDLRECIEDNGEAISGAVLGLSGLDTQADFAAMRDLFEEASLCEPEASMRRSSYGKRLMSKWGFPFLLCSDAILPLFANGFSSGAVVISGTGSIALRISDDGSIERFGGWGYMVSDEGSGTWIGCTFIKEALSACDRAVSSSPAVKKPTKAEATLIEEAYKAISPKSARKLPLVKMARQVREWAMANNDPKAYAALARTVIESKGKVCRKISEQAQSMLAYLAIDACSNDTQAIVLSGGAFKNAAFADGVKSKMTRRASIPSAKILVNKRRPTDGGFQIARLTGMQRPAKAPSATSEAVRKSMQGNKGAGTKPELLVRQRLRDAGLSGYRLHWKAPGRPDVAWPGKKVCIFINGCFWHRHEGCKLASMPKSNVEYWTIKFDRNVERDERNMRELEDSGWTVHTIWECELSSDRIDETFERLLAELFDELR